MSIMVMTWRAARWFSTQSRLRRGLGECWEDCSAILQQFPSPLSISGPLSDSVDGRCSHTLWPSDGFAICAVSRHWHIVSMIGLKVRRETAQIAKGWPSFRSSLTRSRSCGYLHQSTKYTWSLNPWCKRNAETRDLGLKTRGDRCEAGCRVSHVRGLNARGSVQCEKPELQARGRASQRSACGERSRDQACLVDGCGY